MLICTTLVPEEQGGAPLKHIDPFPVIRIAQALMTGYRQVQLAREELDELGGVRLLQE